VVQFAAEQLDVEPEEFAAYRARRQNRYEHAWEIRDTYGYREFPAAEGDRYLGLSNLDSPVREKSGVLSHEAHSAPWRCTGDLRQRILSLTLSGILEFRGAAACSAGMLGTVASADEVVEVCVVASSPFR
jgi:hypothetical protein